RPCRLAVLAAVGVPLGRGKRELIELVVDGVDDDLVEFLAIHRFQFGSGFIGAFLGRLFGLGGQSMVLVQRRARAYSSKSVRASCSRSSAYRIRLLTVFSGVPVISAIS